MDLDRADYYSDKLIDADEKISEGWTTYHQNMTQLETLKALIDQGIIGPGHPSYLQGGRRMRRTAKTWLFLVTCVLMAHCFGGESFAQTTSMVEQGKVQTIGLAEAIERTWANNIELKLLEKQIS